MISSAASINTMNWPTSKSVRQMMDREKKTRFLKKKTKKTKKKRKRWDARNRIANASSQLV